MSQQISVAIVVGLFTVAAAMLGLIGVLVKVWVDFRQSKRTADTAQAGVDIQQQVADSTRYEKLVEETEDLRTEIRQLWEANRQMRHDFEAADTRHEEEKRSIRQECTNLARRSERAEAERDIALAAQERAEGGLRAAQKIIADLHPLK